MERDREEGGKSRGRTRARTGGTVYSVNLTHSSQPTRMDSRHVPATLHNPPSWVPPVWPVGVALPHSHPAWTCGVTPPLSEAEHYGHR